MMKQVLSVIVWIAALCFCLFFADKLMRRDDTARKFNPFFDEKQPIDVFFMGTSRMLDGVSPMELWRDTGITSYNMASSSECLGMTEWVLRLAMDVHKPKVAVIDVYYIDKALDAAWTYPYRHLFLDAVPFSKAKFDAVRATLPESEWLEFLMPFSLYHGRWDEILSGKTARMIDCEPFMMGFELRLGHTIPEDYPRTHDMDTSEQPGTEALRRIAALCRENGIEPLFISIPAPVSEDMQKKLNGVQIVCDELGVPFLNLYDIPDLVNFKTDCYDSIGHLNPDGAAKVTRYLGEYLSTHYDLEDRRNDPDFAHWNDRLDQYESFRSLHWPS